MITNKFICEIFFYDSTHLLIVFAKTSKTPFCRWNDKLMNFVNEYLQRNNNNVILGQFRQHFKIFTNQSFLCVFSGQIFSPEILFESFLEDVASLRLCRIVSGRSAQTDELGKVCVRSR